MASDNNADFQSNLNDIQGLLIRGYSNLEAACFVLLGIEEVDPARRWLGSLVDEIVAGDTKPAEVAVNIAFTFAGLQKLGLSPETLTQFSQQFQEGMTTDYQQRILGDQGDSAPEQWSWGGPNTAPVHILLMLYAATEGEGVFRIDLIDAGG